MRPTSLNNYVSIKSEISKIKLGRPHWLTLPASSLKPAFLRAKPLTAPPQARRRSFPGLSAFGAATDAAKEFENISYVRFRLNMQYSESPQLAAGSFNRKNASARSFSRLKFKISSVQKISLCIRLPRQRKLGGVMQKLHECRWAHEWRFSVDIATEMVYISNKSPD